MCVNYLCPHPDQLPLFGVEPGGLVWQEEAWQDYAAPFIVAGRQGLELRLGNYGLVPKRHQPDGLRLSTTNARLETVAELKNFRYPWRAGQRCLVPMRAFFEPSYETGRAVRWRIGLADDAPFAVAGLWRAWSEPDGSISHAFTQLTVNAEAHALMRRTHKPEDEKRSLVIVRPEDYLVWLTARRPDNAHRLLRLFPAEEMRAEDAPLAPRQGGPKPAPQPLPRTLGLFD